MRLLSNCFPFQTASWRGESRVYHGSFVNLRTRREKRTRKKKDCLHYFLLLFHISYVKIAPLNAPCAHCTSWPADPWRRRWAAAVRRRSQYAASCCCGAHSTVCCQTCTAPASSSTSASAVCTPRVLCMCRRPGVQRVLKRGCGNKESGGGRRGVGEGGERRATARQPCFPVTMVRYLGRNKKKEG